MAARKPGKRGRTSKRPNGTGRIDRLPSGRWRARYVGPDGRERSAPATFDAKGDAEAWLAGQDRQVNAGTWAADDGSAGLTFGAYSELWLVERPIKPRTHEHYRRLLDQHILPTFRTVPLDAITVQAVKRWYRTLAPEAPTTRAHAYGLLRTIMGTAYQEDLVPANPCRIRGGGQVTRATRTEVPTAVQVHQLADEMAPGHPSHAKYRTLVLVSAWCGLRFGEATELRRGDVVPGPDGLPAVLRVRRAVVRVEKQFVVQTPKSAAGSRDVVIPPHIRPDLADYMETKVPPASDSLLFPGSLNGGHMAPGSLQKVFYAARDRVGLPTLRVHDLRHFAATAAAGTGATLAELQSRLGHSTVSAAMRYQHAAADADARIAEALSDNVIALPVTVNQ